MKHFILGLTIIATLIGCGKNDPETKVTEGTKSAKVEVAQGESADAEKTYTITVGASLQNGEVVNVTYGDVAKTLKVGACTTVKESDFAKLKIVLQLTDEQMTTAQKNSKTILKEEILCDSTEKIAVAATSYYETEKNNCNPVSSEITLDSVSSQYGLDVKEKNVACNDGNKVTPPVVVADPPVAVVADPPVAVVADPPVAVVAVKKEDQIKANAEAACKKAQKPETACTDTQVTEYLAAQKEQQ